MRKLLIRSSIIFFWVALIAAVLYFPKWKWANPEERSINIFAWGDILEPSVIAQFEQETGIKIHLNYYSSNEEMLTKLKATRGEGYDLIIPSDYAVRVLVEENLLKAIDHTKLPFWKEINPSLINHPFDPNNQYSIPFEWEVFGLGIDKTYFQDRTLNRSWKLIFDQKIIDYKITMINDPIEAVFLASFYLYGALNTLTPAQTFAVKELLIQQRKWVEAYADFRADYFLATKSCPVVLASSSYIWRTKRLFDFVGFVVPEEGTLITIESFCIPAASRKEKLTYELINYLFRPASVAKHFQTYGLFPATLQSSSDIQLDAETKALLDSNQESFQHYHFLNVLIPQQEIRDIWVEVKSGDH